MKFSYLLICYIFFSSCTVTKYVESTSQGERMGLDLREGKSNAKSNYSLIQSLINDEKSEVIGIDIPSGSFYIDGTLHNDNKRLVIKGVDKFRSKLIFLNGGSNGIEFSKKGSSYFYGCKIENLSLQGPSLNTLVSVEKQRGFRMENVNLIGGQHGITIDFVYDLLISDCYISKFKKIGIDISDNKGSNTTLYVEHCHIEGEGDAIHVGGTGGLRIDKTIIQSNYRGIVEKDGTRGSTITVRDSHFEGNQMECFYQERSFKPGKSPSFISIENTPLLRGPKTDKDSPVAYLNFGSIYMKNSNVSYFKRVDRAPGSINKNYSKDFVEQFRYENPVRPNFLYKKQ